MLVLYINPVWSWYTHACACVDFLSVVCGHQANLDVHLPLVCGALMLSECPLVVVGLLYIVALQWYWKTVPEVSLALLQSSVFYCIQFLRFW